MNPQEKVRRSVCAGSWYTDNPKKLAKEIDGYLRNAKKLNLEIKVIIVPHAGYMFSGQTAAYAFRQIPETTRRVIILGTAHYYPLKGASISDYDFYQTPLGMVRVDDISRELLNEKKIDSIREADTQEHSIEIEIPFIQQILDNFSIIPIIVGDIDPEYFSEILEKIYDEKSVIVVSVDLSHFHTYDRAKELDSYSVNCILNLDADGIKEAEIDSPYAVMSLIKLAKRKKWKARLLHSCNSGDVTGDKSRVVGYSAIIFYESDDESEYTKDERNYILKLARNAVELFTKEGTALQVSDIPDTLKKKKACFVTIRKNGELRGCIGNIEPTDKLYKNIINNAISAATKDYRFERVSVEELDSLEYEVSILDNPKTVFFESENELFGKIKNKGVIIESTTGFHRALYLPQVWEHFKSEKDFLNSLFRKAGISGYSYSKLSETEIKIFNVVLIE